MPEHNSHGFHHRDRIDKGIQRGLHDLNSVGCAEMPDGLTGAPMRPDPHGQGPKANVHMPASSRRPVGAPTEMHPPHRPGPHDHLHPAPHELASKVRR
jgi:hypothetical protein